MCFYCFFGAVVVCFVPILAKLTLKNDFYDAKEYLPFILLAAILNCMSSVLGSLYSTYKKTDKMVHVSIVGAVTNVISGVVLVPHIGIWGGYVTLRFFVI